MARKMKDSGVEWIGKIPEHLNVINNKYLLRFIKGRNPKELNSDKNGLPYIGAADLEKDGDNCEYGSYSMEKLPSVEKDEALVLWDGARAGVIGIGHYGYIGSTIVKVIPAVDYIDKKFWYWYLKGFQPILLNWVGGTTIPHMSRKFINDIKLIDYSLKQQEKIANFLDEKTSEIDGIKKDIEKEIEVLEDYKKSIIFEAVTKGLDKNVEMKDSGVEWIGEIPKDWKVHPISRYFIESKNINKLGKEKNLLSLSYGKIIRKDIDSNEGLLPKNFNNYNIVKEGNIIIRLLDLQNDKKSLRTGYVKEKGIITSAYIALKPLNSVFSQYYYYLLHSYDIMKVFYNMGDGVRQSLNYKEFSKLLVLEPPFEQQKKIVEFIIDKEFKINNLLESKKEQLLVLEEYKKSMIYEYVTGKKEVI